jgi:hypothetical protein
MGKHYLNAHNLENLFLLVHWGVVFAQETKALCKLDEPVRFTIFMRGAT